MWFYKIKTTRSAARIRTVGFDEGGGVNLSVSLWCVFYFSLQLACHGVCVVQFYFRLLLDDVSLDRS
jgi:hypothetical protein